MKMNTANCPSCGQNWESYKIIIKGSICHDCCIKRYGRIILHIHSMEREVDVVLFKDAKGYGLANKNWIDTVLFNVEHMSKEQAYKQWEEILHPVEETFDFSFQPTALK